MCGILCLLCATGEPHLIRSEALRASSSLRHRGPDFSGLKHFPEASQQNSAQHHYIGHERLAIVSPNSGAQPLDSTDENFPACLTVNGEIYNHEEIRKEFSNYKFSTASDCEVVLPLVRQAIKNDGDVCKAVERLDGMFAWVVLVMEQGKPYRIIAARDHIGICPMYWGVRHDGGLMFASELKALQNYCTEFTLFPPGHCFDSSLVEGDLNSCKSIPTTGLKLWYNPSWRTSEIKSLKLYKESEENVLKLIREELTRAVKKRMMADVPWGVLLSGGLDSSLVASIATKLIKEDPALKAQNFRLLSFSIGLEGSPDLAAAKKVSEYLGTEHHAWEYTVQEGIDALRDVIWYLETYDVTTIRASTPMWIMARRIKAMGFKMVLSGEGADEAMAGYLYFHKAPDGKELHEETVRKLDYLHYFDCLRANKSMSAFGVEPRVPFLDRDFLELVMNINPEFKIPRNNNPAIEKYLVRKAFDLAGPDGLPYLPAAVLWRQKEQFSDGVGYSWIDGLRDNGELLVAEPHWEKRAELYPVNTPKTKEAFVYRSIFEELFPSKSAQETIMGGPSVACSTAKAVEWDEEFKKMVEGTNGGGDNSGRAVVGVHNSAYEDVAAEVTRNNK